MTVFVGDTVIGYIHVLEGKLVCQPEYLEPSLTELLDLLGGVDAFDTLDGWTNGVVWIRA